MLASDAHADPQPYPPQHLAVEVAEHVEPANLVGRHQVQCPPADDVCPVHLPAAASVDRTESVLRGSGGSARTRATGSKIRVPTEQVHVIPLERDDASEDRSRSPGCTPTRSQGGSAVETVRAVDSLIERTAGRTICRDRRCGGLTPRFVKNLCIQDLTPRCRPLGVRDFRS